MGLPAWAFLQEPYLGSMQNQTGHLVKPHCFLGSAISWKPGINFPPYRFAKRSLGAAGASRRPLSHPLKLLTLIHGLGMR